MDKYVYDCQNYTNVHQMSQKEIERRSTLHSSGDQFVMHDAVRQEPPKTAGNFWDPDITPGKA